MITINWLIIYKDTINTNILKDLYTKKHAKVASERTTSFVSIQKNYYLCPVKIK